MKIYKDTDIINDVIDFLMGIPVGDQPILTVWVRPPNIIHEGMKYYSSNTKILGTDNTTAKIMIRALQTKNLDGYDITTDTRLIRELHVYWNFTKYDVPDELLKDPLLTYPKGYIPPEKKIKKRKVHFVAPPQRRVKIG